MSLKISVYITSYNQKKYLEEAIESVLQQTLAPHQIIIVDDCSTDGSQELIASYAKKYFPLITPIYHNQNQGVARTRIDALKAVTGDYVTYVDGDDRFLPTKLEQEAKLLVDNPEAKIAFSNYYITQEDGTQIGVWIEEEKPPQGYIFSCIFGRDLPQGTHFRSELVDYHAWKQIGFYDPQLSLYEDDEMRMRLTKHLKVVYFDEPLSEYRHVKDGLSRVSAAKYLAALEYIYKKNLSLLDDLDLQERNYLKHKARSLLAQIAIWSVIESLEESQASIWSRAKALKYFYLSLMYKHHYSNYFLLLKIMMPNTIYSWCKSIYQS